MEEKLILLKGDISSVLWRLGYKIQTIPETVQVNKKIREYHKRLKKAVKE